MVESCRNHWVKNTLYVLRLVRRIQEWISEPEKPQAQDIGELHFSGLLMCILGAGF
ncbi:TPA: hypothetical protein ACPSKY_002832 [Legionella bozemanae]